MSNLHRHPDIVAMENGAAEQRLSRIEAIKSIQAKCEHDKIVTDTLGSGARRICCACGLEELNRYYSWPGETADGGLYEFMRPAGRTTVLNSEFVKVGNVCALRVRI